MKVRSHLPKRGPLAETQRLLAVVHDLRRNCPWDRKQTHRTLIRYLLEEAYETVAAIEQPRRHSLREELGDLLLQVTLHAELAAERNEFTFEDVAREISEKMIRRHPHIYVAKESTDARQHSRRWTELKRRERPDKLLLEGIPTRMPALQLAQRYGEIAASVGFDWEAVPQVLKKVREEMAELQAELDRRFLSKAAVEMELGDLLFTLANLARHLHVDAEAALRKSSRKFADRFTRLEKRKRRQGRSLADCSAEELDREWNEIKTKAKTKTQRPRPKAR